MKKFFNILMGLLLPGIAMAQSTTGPFTPPSTDVSMKVLAALFGNLGVFNAAGASDAFGAVMAIFNGAVLIIGGILATYTILAGTLGTAHDGEMLGKKFSSVWVPIRYSLGTALVLPVINGQYATINYIVGWALMQGVGLADNVWTTYMSSSNIQNQMTVGIAEPSAGALGWNTFSSLACMRGYALTLKNQGDSVLMGGPVPAVGMTKVSGISSTIYQFGFPKGGAGFTPTSCGTLTVKNFEMPLNANTDVGQTSLLGNASLAIQSASTIATQNQAAVDTLVSTLDGVASGWVQNTSSDPSLQVSTAIATYQATIKGNAASLIAQYSNLQELQNSATKDGWAFAGAYYMKVSYLMDMAGRVTASIPTATGMQFDNQKFSQDFMNQYAAPLRKLQNTNDSAGSFAINSTQGGSADDFGVYAWVKSGFDSSMAIKHIFAKGATFVLDSGANPVLEMKRLGQWTLALAGGVSAGYVSVLTGLSEVPSQGTTSTTIAVALLPIMLTVVPILFATGFTLTYVLPMMPFMMWIGIFLGWIIMALEAMVISSMWAVMHLHPNGDDLTGKGANGYSLLLSLMLRPTFAVFGLIASLNIIYVLGQVINKIFADAFLLSQTDANIFVWIFGLIAAPLIYCGLMWTIVRKCFSATSSIADEMLKWFGGQGASLGRTSEELGGNGAGTYAAALGAAKVAGGGLGGVKDGAGLLKQGRNETAQKEQAFDSNKNNFNDKFGLGAADKKNAALGIGNHNDFASLKGQQNSQAYDSGMNLAQSAGGEEGAEQFADKMLDASHGGFSEYGGSAVAASESISNDIASDAISKDVSEKFGGDGLAYVNAMASTGSLTSNGANKLDTFQAQKAMKDLSKAQGMLGDNFGQVLNNAVTQNGASKDSIQSYMAAKYNEIKSAEAAQSNAPVDTIEKEKSL